ncbi:unnamed protein product [Plutella xylostella]|uniref:(diamondback moth) hypothetical protein n=1 Tax=Plutella xylostella TaxID=51655 RepID=A0A8S4G2X2_PLUXY|nr:unnamed protein product [Plutella xylostella]
MLQLDYRESFEEQYFNLIAVAKCLLDDESPSSSAKCAPFTNIKLPDIKLPSFDGSYDRWLEFRNSYVTMIHERTDLDCIQKFHYLKSSLTGSASQVISALEFTADNYTHAWELLEKRYHNDRLLVHNHVKSLFNIHTVSKESPGQLRKLIDTVLRNLRALQTLHEPTSHWDTLLIYLIVNKLDESSEREWEQHKGTLLSNSESNKLKLDDLMTFLRNRADFLEMINANQSNSKVTVKQVTTESKVAYEKKGSSQNNYVHSYVSTNKNKSTDKRSPRSCVMCNKSHPLFTCSYFLNIAVGERTKIAQQNGLCVNCLRAGHSVADCLFGPCRQCQQKHNSLLHTNQNDSSTRVLPEKVQESVSLSSTLGSQPTNTNSQSNDQLLNRVLLSTVLVDVAGDNNEYHTARALLDNGSEHNFISEKLSKRLNTKLIQSTLNVTGVGNKHTNTNHLCDITMRSKVQDYSTPLRCIVLSSITSHLPSTRVDVQNIRIPENIRLADPSFHVPSEVELLIGSDLFWDLIESGKIRLSSGTYLIDSKLGWLLSGPIPNTDLRMNYQVQCNFTQTIDSQLRQFCELDEIPNSKPSFILDEQKCEDLFTSTTIREASGRFSVRMPLNEPVESLGDCQPASQTNQVHFESLPEMKSTNNTTSLVSTQPNDELFDFTKQRIAAYLLRFCCLSTRAIHLELVSGLSTNDYVLALIRFSEKNKRKVIDHSANQGTYAISFYPSLLCSFWKFVGSGSKVLQESPEANSW